jgi:PAS domain S-box-containing protein
MEDRSPTGLDSIDEQRLALVTNSVPVLLAYISDGARYVWCNEGYRRWFGRSPESIRGRHMREMLGEAAWVELQPHVERALAGEEVVFERRIVKGEGQERDVRVAYIPDRGSGGRVRGFVALVTDVSEMRGAERALRASERMLAESQAAAHVGSWEATLGENPATCSLRWSDETYRIFGFEPGSVEIDYGRFLGSIHPDDREVVTATADAGIEQGGRFEKEYRIVRPDGAVRVIHAWTNVERDATGRVSRLLGTSQDITERRLAEREIRQTREQLQLVVDATPALIARYDRDCRLVWANRSYAARFGLKPEDLVGKHLRELVGEEAIASIEPGIARVLAGETLEQEAEVSYPTMGRRSMHFVAAPTFDVRGAPDGCVAVITDNTHRRALERERESALQELKEADRQKDEFLAMLSHELRNPLAPILTAVEVLRLSDPNDGETAATFRDVIERQVAHMKRLLDDLLDVSRVSRGKIELRRELLELAPLLQRAVEVSRPHMAEKDQRLSVTSPSAPVLVDADPVRLVQVFGNLLNNAAKYSERGGSIEVELAVEDREAVVRVRDHGVGMSPELLERAFDLFVQDTRAFDRAQGGMGIGLTMVRSLVNMHGGQVHAFSDGPGRGCEMVVRLPRASEAVPPPGPAPPRRAPVTAARPLRILVVDDNVDAANTLGQLLEVLGHQVALAHDGPGALTTAAAAPPEMVFVDIGLPGMDGYALATALRAAGLDRVSLVAVTGYGRDQDIRRSSEHGFEHHLVKPVDLAALHRIALLRGRA